MPNNHPRKNSIIRTDPIRFPEKIREIEQLLSSRPRDAAIFVLGCNTNLRAVDILGLSVGVARDMQPGATLVLREKKRESRA